MLSSDDARRACECYYPSTRGHTQTVHFAVPPVLEVSFREARTVADSYGLPERFIFMPNQFWRHKNHLLVLDALSLLRSQGKKVVVVASGKQADLRDPNYFPNFFARRDACGLQDEFRLLGLIPYPHIFALMRACTALLNPSLFEGWSTTVEEARAMGTPMLLSDLEVHQEQMGAQAIYFSRNSARSLADALAGIAGEAPCREHLAEAARRAAHERARQFASNFANLAGWCLGCASRS